MSFCCHSNVILLSFRCHFIFQDLTRFLWWNDPKMKKSLVARSFYFRTRRNDTWSSFDGTTGTSLERPSLFGKGGPNGVEGGSNDPRHQVIPFFVPVIQTSFLIRGSFGVIREGKKHLEWPPNEVGTREGEGQKWADFPHRKASFLHHSTVVLLILISFYWFFWWPSRSSSQCFVTCLDISPPLAPPFKLDKKAFEKY